jgi:outer membrane biosynthesis protein TonB
MHNSKFNMQTLNGRRFALFACCILHFALLGLFAGCSAKAKAQTLPDGPPLAVPSAPAHVVAIEQIAAEEPSPELPPAPEPAPQTPTVPPARTSAPRREPPAPQPAVTPQPPPETPAVRAAPAASANETKVRALIKKAGEDLLLVDYKKLSKEGQGQYDQSKRFSDEAEMAIKERNFPYALTLAEKAANLAAELVP